MSWAKWGGGSAASANPLSLLIFHRVLPHPDPLNPYEPDAAHFDQMLRWLRGYTVLPLEQAIRRLREGSLPAGALSITFDDGYADNHDVALPILRRHGMSATFFVSSAYLDGGRMWSDTLVEAVRRCSADVLDLDDLLLGRHRLDSPAARRHAARLLLTRLKYMEPGARDRCAQQVARAARAHLPDDLMLSRAQLRAMHGAGMTIGSHTRTHPILTTVPDDVARDEIVASRDDLEAVIDAPVTLFAYPNGRPRTDYHPRHCEMVRRAGYSAALTTASGVSRTGADLYQLPRFTPWDRTALRFRLRMLLNKRQPTEVAL
ncbi:polysaccharide deacetylase family protein [Azohydromonas lata]|uniref:polysaccharide deacetylase family protein n=1 Tax=Azohydromonas lata TaxID=45677 RepID=UPI00082E50E7|nr:polysaccharide deacetylase family protein [Azohydromonas lata]